MTDDAMMQRLALMTTPSKPLVRRCANGLGIKIAHSLRDTFNAKCRFERKGSVFDDKIHHVSDIDILIFVEDCVGLATAMAHVLSSFKLHPFAIMVRDSCGKEHEFQTNVLPDDAFNESIETISVSMPLKMGKYTLPFDLTFTTAIRGRDEPIEHRIEKMEANIKAGKFDKALQRLRPLLTRLGATRDARDAITAAMNDRTGFVRFVHKQLKLSVDSKRVTHAVASLGIQSDELEHALEVASRRNIVEARAVVIEFIDEIKAVAEGSAFEEAMRAALTPLDQPRVTIGGSCEKGHGFDDRKLMLKQAEEKFAESDDFECAILHSNLLHRRQPDRRGGFNRDSIFDRDGPPRGGFDRGSAFDRDLPRGYAYPDRRDFLDRGGVCRRDKTPNKSTKQLPEDTPRPEERELVSFVFDPADIGASGPVESWWV